MDSEEKEKLWSCPNCGTPMQKVNERSRPYRICNNCGCTIEGQEQDFNPGNLCPNCNQELNGLGECPHCGYDLGSDFD